MHPYRFAIAVTAVPVLWIATVLAGYAVQGTAVSPRAHQLECGRQLTQPADESVPLTESVRVVLVTDEEWRATVGQLGMAARHVVFDAASLFRGMSIHLLAVRSVDWVSPADATTIRDIWLAAREAVALTEGDEDVVVVLSAQRRSTIQDGYANVGGRYVAVAHHPDHPERDAFVLAHEISHLFGANHGCDVAGRVGLMAAQGFDHDLVCPCTRRILELNANRFHDLAGGTS